MFSLLSYWIVLDSICENLFNLGDVDLILSRKFNFYRILNIVLPLFWDTGAFQPQKHHRGDASLREKLLGAKDGGASRNNNESDATVLIPSSPIPVNTKFVDQYHGSSPSTDYYYK